MLLANGFSAIQIKPAATISLIQYKTLTCSLLQVNTPTERPPLNFSVGISVTYSVSSAFSKVATRQHQGMAEHHNNYFI